MRIFITGGTGYIGRRLTEILLERGHQVRVLARAGSIARVAPGASVIVGDALDAGSFGQQIGRGDTLVHLVGTPHPSPAKAAEFRRVDLPSVQAAVQAAAAAGVAHFVYVSVAHPAPVMREYIAARTEGEAAIARAQLTATILRPWYVLGPGHRWPLLLKPVYAALERIPATRAAALRLGLVTIDSMIAALVSAIETPPPSGTRRIVEAAGIRAALLR
jgi:uncharacterized protein YbjT (DUF2867 family)